MTAKPPPLHKIRHTSLARPLHRIAARPHRIIAHGIARAIAHKFAQPWRAEARTCAAFGARCNSAPSYQHAKEQSPPPSAPLRARGHGSAHAFGGSVRSTRAACGAASVGHRKPCGIRLFFRVRRSSPSVRERVFFQKLPRGFRSPVDRSPASAATPLQHAALRVTLFRIELCRLAHHVQPLGVRRFRRGCRDVVGGEASVLVCRVVSDRRRFQVSPINPAAIPRPCRPAPQSLRSCGPIAPKGLSAGPPHPRFNDSCRQ